jgi:hypothetical protein
VRGQGVILELRGFYRVTARVLPHPAMPSRPGWSLANQLSASEALLCMIPPSARKREHGYGLFFSVFDELLVKFRLVSQPTAPSHS